MELRKSWRAAPMNVLYKYFSLEYFLDAAAMNGFESIELWGAAPHLYIEACTTADLLRVRRALESRYLRACCLTPESTLYPVNIASGDAVLRRRSLKNMLRSIEVAAELGIPLVQVVSGTGYYNEPIDEAWKWSRDSLETAVRKAESLGLELSLEPLLPYESNLVNSLTSVQRMLEELDTEVLGVHLDTVAMEAAGETLEACLRTLGSRVKHIQLCDGPGGHLAWGDGSLPLDSNLDVLEQHGYQGYLGLEMFDHSYYIDPDQVLKQCADQMRKEGVKPGGGKEHSYE
ncbi:sugar phosphate isomerase/epimerase [Paenibacillus albidus]|uniref:sugar phosphate isomerase/epimerase family protein n=1 Tax=Paenibacillus albidus TaxID=2041023 RepID=UPI001BEA11FC|nr:sugar phosphate isomerase/epimerase family protein [Paenibacillus albidus]MBT2293652.1 sugar phosphate isomerase/epimerase [Paenibacillus albidus]